MNAEEIIKWVEVQPNMSSSDEKTISEFVKNLQNKILELDFNLPDGRIALGYAGSLGDDGNKTGMFRTIDVITGDGRYGFINDVGDNILNYKYIDSIGDEVTLWDAIAKKTNPLTANIILNGAKDASAQCQGSCQEK